MKKNLASIQLKDYVVTEVEFNLGVHEPKEFEFIPDFGLFKKEDSGVVEVKFIVTEEGFKLSGTVAGFFSYDSSLSEFDVKNLLAGNGLAILFPYVRSTITNLTSAINIPSVIVPTMNILEYMKEKFEKEKNKQLETADIHSKNDFIP